jgi:hypothetical protein
MTLTVSGSTDRTLSDRKLSRRIERLGASNFESIKDTAQRQADMVRRVEEVVGVPSCQGFRDCRPDECGLLRCSPGCWFNLRRRWLKGVLSAHELFSDLDVPLFEVRIIREEWHRPLGKLNTMNVQSAKQFARRRFDARNGREAIMIGSYKVARNHYEDDRWVGEIHAVVGGSDKIALRGAFRFPFNEGLCYTYVEEVDDLPTTLIEALRPDVRVWQQPYAVEPIKVPGKKQRTEFYRWLLRLRPDERLFRYGCDQFFRPIVKKPPRPVVIKPKKKRPYPEWLVRYQYDSHDSQCTCRVCMNRQNK